MSSSSLSLPQHHRPQQQPHRKKAPNFHPQVIMITLQQYIHQWIRIVWICLQRFWDRFFGGETLTFEDSGLTVRVGKALAEGGFSIVLQATDATQPHRRSYALKRIRLAGGDDEILQACQWEASVHRHLQEEQPQNVKYLMPLYGMIITHQFCYMLFPLIPHSLRTEVNRRTFERSSNANNTSAPWSNESDLFGLLAHVCEAAALMHTNGYAHCDLKLENMLCQGSNHQHLLHPIVMDFGSAASPVTTSLATRQDVLNIVDRASQHTTISYRPPELFPGELRQGDADLDYTKVDVWSLGCVLFAVAFGASPLESQFARNPQRRQPHQQQQGNDYPLQVVECTQLRVLGDVPKPRDGTMAADWYSSDFWSLVEWMLTKDRARRPTLSQVQQRLQMLLNHRGGGDVEENNNSFPVDF